MGENMECPPPYDQPASEILPSEPPRINRPALSAYVRKEGTITNDDYPVSCHDEYQYIVLEPKLTYFNNSNFSQCYDHAHPCVTI